MRRAGTIIAILAIAGCSGHTAHAPPPTREGVRAAPPAPLTAAQLEAHLGVGMPRLWVPVDAGDARVWVPNIWKFAAPGSCAGVPPANPPLISVGSLPQVHCAPAAEFPVPPQAVGFLPLSGQHSGPPLLTVHGYAIYKGKPTAPGAPWKYYDIPQLGVQIATHGSRGRRIIGTLGPSARNVALNGAYQHVPPTWHLFAEDGASLSIPPTWHIARPTSTGCGDDLTPMLVVISQHYGPSGCISGPPRVYPSPSGQPPVYRVTLYTTANNPFAPKQSYDASHPDFGVTGGKPIATLRHGATTLSIYASIFGDLDVFARHDGSTRVHVFAISPGRDGRVAARVLASIEAPE